MLTYKDTTFCTARDCGSFPHCRRAFTDNEQARAHASGLPVALFIEPKQLSCYDPGEPAPRTPKRAALLVKLQGGAQ